jgi:hypothetical protein
VSARGGIPGEDSYARVGLLKPRVSGSPGLSDFLQLTGDFTREDKGTVAKGRTRVRKSVTCRYRETDLGRRMEIKIVHGPTDAVGMKGNGPVDRIGWEVVLFFVRLVNR